MALRDIFAAIAANEDQDSATAIASILNSDVEVRKSINGSATFMPADVQRIGAIVRSYMPRISAAPPSAAGAVGQAAVAGAIGGTEAGA